MYFLGRVVCLFVVLIECPANSSELFPDWEGHKPQSNEFLAEENYRHTPENLLFFLVVQWATKRPVFLDVAQAWTRCE